MESTRWWDYVENLMRAAGWNKADVARAAGVDQSVVGRWQNKGAAPEASSVRGIATAFGRDIREAAIAAGMFTAAELHGRRGEPIIDPETFDLSVIPNKRLRDEIYARMEYGRATCQRTAASADGTSIPTSSGRDVTDVSEQQLPLPPNSMDGSGGEHDHDSEGEISPQG